MCRSPLWSHACEKLIQMLTCIVIIQHSLLHPVIFYLSFYWLLKLNNNNILLYGPLNLEQFESFHKWLFKDMLGNNNYFTP